MKRKFAGIAALGMALTLAFGMTVSAAPSPDTGSNVVVDTNVAVEDSGVTAEDLLKAQEDVKVPPTVGMEVNGETVSVGLSVKASNMDKQAQAEAALKTPEKQAEVTEKVNDLVAKGEIKLPGLSAGTKVSVKLKPKASVDIEITLPEGVDENALKENGVVVPITSSEITSGKYYFVVHITKSGESELLGPACAVDGTIKVTFHSFSPAMLAEADFDVAGLVEVEPPDDDYGDSHWEGGPDYVPSAPTSGAKTSPQTGDVLPIAGFMAVICLAGAVVCVRKAHN